MRWLSKIKIGAVIAIVRSSRESVETRQCAISIDSLWISRVFTDERQR